MALFLAKVETSPLCMCSHVSTSHRLQIPADIPTQPELLDGKPEVGAMWLLLPDGKKLLNRPEFSQMSMQTAMSLPI